uniref:KIB1-4 beta-propeller domain-containing protein n=1 Tax=Oryza meridionalis TaxID=40149 RepID=A0A0E0D3Q9_9ORYZ
MGVEKDDGWQEKGGDRPPDLGLYLWRRRWHRSPRGLVVAASPPRPPMHLRLVHVLLDLHHSPPKPCHHPLSRNGWYAFYDSKATRIMNALTSEEIPFHSFLERNAAVLKVVFMPNPTLRSFTVAALISHGRVTYTTSGNSRWTDVKCPCIVALNYGDYCLMGSNDVLVLRLAISRHS